mmetsp:Transcript_18946/g.52206  ORF Transcript_18946/g.52206 Transcript_18946/m.52206 type:complete len:538 (+) Transcript_18946:507-2120(+)
MCEPAGGAVVAGATGKVPAKARGPEAPVSPPVGRLLHLLPAVLRSPARLGPLLRPKSIAHGPEPACGLVPLLHALEVHGVELPVDLEPHRAPTATGRLGDALVGLGTVGVPTAPPILPLEDPRPRHAVPADEAAEALHGPRHGRLWHDLRVRGGRAPPRDDAHPCALGQPHAAPSPVGLHEHLEDVARVVELRQPGLALQAHVEALAMEATEARAQDAPTAVLAEAAIDEGVVGAPAAASSLFCGHDGELAALHLHVVPGSLVPIEGVATPGLLIPTVCVTAADHGTATIDFLDRPPAPRAKPAMPGLPALVCLELLVSLQGLSQRCNLGITAGARFLHARAPKVLVPAARDPSEPLLAQGLDISAIRMEVVRRLPAQGAEGLHATRTHVALPLASWSDHCVATARVGAPDDHFLATIALAAGGVAAAAAGAAASHMGAGSAGERIDGIPELGGFESLKTLPRNTQDTEVLLLKLPVTIDAWTTREGHGVHMLLHAGQAIAVANGALPALLLLLHKADLALPAVRRSQDQSRHTALH